MTREQSNAEKQQLIDAVKSKGIDNMMVYRLRKFTHHRQIMIYENLERATTALWSAAYDADPKRNPYAKEASKLLDLAIDAQKQIIVDNIENILVIKKGRVYR